MSEEEKKVIVEKAFVIPEQAQPSKKPEEKPKEQPPKEPPKKEN